MTSFGIDNTGKLILTYGKEDIDYYVDGDSESGYIYRAAPSTFFCRLRDLFGSEMQAMFVDRENVNAWSASRLIKQWDDSQNQFPEELWRLDIQRKYLRTYQGISIDNSLPGEANPRFLTEMMNGRKKYQRRMFERNQELYMATKYFGKVATQDQIMMRFNNPVGATITPDFTLYITPYSDMYIGTSFGNVTPTNFRAKAGVEYPIPCSIESGTADITLIYGASFIQAIGDLSRCYVGDNDFSKASRLQSLVIGSDVEGYSNSFMTKIALGNNKLLEYLDIRNITGLNSVVDLSECANLLELHAEGSGATGVIFANGGKLQKAYIPAIISLTLKNLNNIEEFSVSSYDNLQTLIVEYTPFIDTYEIVTISPALRVLRLAGIDWNIPDTDILESIMMMRGVSNTGGEIPMSVLIGKVNVPVINEYDLYKYQDAWTGLTITGYVKEQYPVTFKNEDGTILETQYVIIGALPVDPITREEKPIATPTKESDERYNYTYAGWDKEFSVVTEPVTYTATYTHSDRLYTVQYISKGNPNPIFVKDDAKYGEYVSCDIIPTYTAEETGYKYYLFDRWNQSGLVTGDKTIEAIFDECQYSSSLFNSLLLEDMRPVHLYAVTRLVEQGILKLNMNADGSDYTDISGTTITPYDEYEFAMGHDYEYADIESEILIDGEGMEFTGSNYYDTGISLMDADRSFVIAVDYEFYSSNSANATLMQCYQSSTSDGFKLYHNGNNPIVTWAALSNAKQCASGTSREVLVIRHIAGESGAYVYTSNLSETSIGYMDFSEAGLRTPIIESTLVFGANKNGTDYMNRAKGKVHWAKLWYADLGENVCEQLASYTHELVEFRLSGFRRHYLTGSLSERPLLNFLGSKALYTKRGMNTSNTNVGGWASANLNSWLNNRFYKGIPLQIRQLLKQVVINSTAGGQSTEITSSNCYIAVPALADLTNNPSQYYTNTLAGEISPGTLISYMTKDDATRVIYDSTGEPTIYWTRSPSLTSSSYFYHIKATGEPYNIMTSYTPSGVVVEFSI